MIHSLIGGLFLAVGGAWAAPAACEELAAVPESLQVAWVAPLGRTVGASASLEVVRVGDLRRVASAGDDPSRLLQTLGILGRRPSEARVDRGWQVVIFDVSADTLCRPMDETETDDERAGIAVCDDAGSKPRRGHKKGWTGCGYSLDTGASTRGLDVYRIDWEVAAARGFCLMPLLRFMDGA